MNQDQNRGGYLNGLVTGMILGAVTVFLMGTEQGRKLSKKLRYGGKRAIEELEEALGEIEDKKVAMAEKATHVAEEWGERVEEVKEDVAAMVEPELNYIDRLREQGRVATQRFFRRDGKTLG
ncbi:MAG: YtxH domain-containing protein [Candidatus Chisholmbacteria bacterium]|nr:YtxH domain-containing protein [Candidatus Chisholmbacteria bacterium]